MRCHGELHAGGDPRGHHASKDGKPAFPSPVNLNITVDESDYMTAVAKECTRCARQAVCAKHSIPYSDPDVQRAVLDASSLVEAHEALPNTLT